MAFRTDLPSLLAAAASQHGRADAEFWLSFSARGEISYCSPLLAQLLGRCGADIQGATVTSLLPALPVNGKTPGYNVATLTMGYVNRCHRLELKLGDGTWLPVEASISSTRLGSGPVFIVQLSSPGRTSIVNSDD